ncbi:GDSL esterase/lipase At4g10955-like [Macadamia integrifolia]|uniref:GDSL esterase/lipase At4g10955-like n=1 Tax=Macadamia integrifolia TaxID=60698 RepID=UPI001C533A63|nr:GDSL esterase/lipase At4g10955-like [Macadamia integrifolia]
MPSMHIFQLIKGRRKAEDRGQVKVSDKDIFSCSGPSHLTTVDWNNADHHRCVASSLVNGVYVLERDYKKNRNGPQSLAPPWWEFFHFQLHRRIMDDSSIFGAVYEFNPPASTSHLSIHQAPRYVIAFRGPILKTGSFTSDLKSNIHMVNDGNAAPRFEIAVQTIQEIFSEHGASNMWLAGHSLGSALAMLVGKNMAKAGVYLPAFLFNPSNFSTPIEWIKDEKLKILIRVTVSLITAGLTIARKDPHRWSASEDAFVALFSWIPSLFVNPSDPNSSEYIGYFEHRKEMEKIGAKRIGEIATQNSIPSLLFGKTESEPLHILPSAKLIINKSSSSNSILVAHQICQWWSKDMVLDTKIYQYRSGN